MKKKHQIWKQFHCSTALYLDAKWSSPGLVISRRSSQGFGGRRPPKPQSNKMLRRPTSVILNVMYRAPADKSSQQRPHHNIRFCCHIYYNTISTPYLIFVRNARNAVSVNFFWLSVKKFQKNEKITVWGKYFVNLRTLWV